MLAVDAGFIGPNYNPGHAHCDCLSFELFIKNKPIFVNCGTFEYQGTNRAFFRSTKAHNTIMINNHEQSECWGEHRVARRIKNVKFSKSTNVFVGSYINYLGEIHERKINFNFKTLSVMDKTSRTKKHSIISSFLHLAPGFVYENGCISGNGCSFKIKLVDCSLEETESMYSPEFGLLHKINCLVFKWVADSAFHGYIVSISDKEILAND